MLTPAADGKAPMAMLDLIRIGTQAVVAQDPFAGEPVIWLIRSEIVFNPLV